MERRDRNHPAHRRPEIPLDDPPGSVKTSPLGIHGGWLGGGSEKRAEAEGCAMRRRLEDGGGRGGQLKGSWDRRRRRWGSTGFKLGFISLLLLLLGGGGAGGQDTELLTKARNEVGDLFNLRKALSGESAYPHQYRTYVSEQETQTSTDALDECCGGGGCTECLAGESIENLRAVKIELQKDINLLYGLGCPCSISEIYPASGDKNLKIPVEVTVPGMSVDAAFELGDIECWWRSTRPGEVEVYSKIGATKVRDDTVACQTPPQTQASYMEVTLHGNGWAVTQASDVLGNTFEMYDAGEFSISGVTPIASPSSGGVRLVVVGSDIDPTRGLQCRVAGRRFPAQVINSTHATCTTPVLTPGKTSLTLSQNGYNWIEEIDFWVYHQPNITVIYPTRGIGNEIVKINLAGLGLSYDPRPEDLFCKWYMYERNVTVPATRIRNSSTISVSCSSQSDSLCFPVAMRLMTLPE